MKPNRHRQLELPAKRTGYTLLEVVVASASATVLVGGLASSLYIAAQSLDAGTGSLADARVANRALEAIHRDLQSALSVTELTATAVTLTVADRNGDSVPENIRYHWSGTTGDPLYQTYNGTTTPLANNVQSFSLAWATRLIEGVSSSPKVLFVSAQPADADGGLTTPSTAEQGRVDLIEGWGYDATVISQSASQSEIDEALADATCVYISGTTSASTVGSKFNATALGVVTESLANAVTLGFYDSLSDMGSTGTACYVVNNTHYITEGFATGDLTILESTQSLKWNVGTPSSEASSIADVSSTINQPSLVILDAEDKLADNSTAAGRRCQLPWGEGGFTTAALNTDGQTIMQRAIEWAAGSGDDTETVSAGIVYEEFTEQQASGSVTQITINLPPSTSEGDLLVAAVAIDGNRASSLTPPAGWTEVVVASEGDNRTTLGVWWRVAGPSEPAGYTFDWSGGEQAYGWIMRFTGHDPVTPIHGSATDEGETYTPTAPSVTTSVDNCMILRIGGFDDDDIPHGDAGMSDHVTITANESNSTGCSGAAAYQMLGSAGTSGSANFTLTGTEEWRTLTIAIEPAP